MIVSELNKHLKALIADQPWIIKCSFDLDSETWFVQVWDMKLSRAVVSNSGHKELDDALAELKRALIEELEHREQDEHPFCQWNWCWGGAC